MLRRHLIINADGFGFTPGINRAIEECIDFGTVRSISVNVNLPYAKDLLALVQRHPEISIGCHLNPVIGEPLLPIEKVRSLVNEQGEFFYREFKHKLNSGTIRLVDLKAELLAQIDYCRDLAGSCFSHIDCHMSVHRLPRFYPTFLEVVKASGIGRIRTHRYRMGMEGVNRRWSAFKYYINHPLRIVIRGWNLWLRYLAKKQHLAMPEWRLCINDMGFRSGTISTHAWISLLKNVPRGTSEFVVHPGYSDAALERWSIYTSQRDAERKILTSPQFRDALLESDIVLTGYRDIKAL
jgi:predicted glycoside hydrolase/deacetylase ChbG (UPF0249 family)